MRTGLVVIFVLGLQAVQAGTISGKINCRGTADHCVSVIYAEAIPRKTTPPPSDPVILDQINMTFVPHVLPVVVGTTVAFPNNDEVPHNVYSPSPAKLFNLGIYPKGASRQVTFDRPGEVQLLCSIHPNMSAYVLVLQQPYFATTAEDGSFSLKDLPPGKYKVTVWHEQYKPISQPLLVKGMGKIPLKLDLVERR